MVIYNIDNYSDRMIINKTATTNVLMKMREMNSDAYGGPVPQEREGGAHHE